ncbi:hypothetical protein DWU98_16330 [Dyella monticola]|uniref:Uncharacterized protein n=1 Tax=Dyella monticola TaxID=1927958 RepID=A0A370WUE3_9GAMM|nr:hypothetical protein [Dyella monticola]RDS79636.1 hypothetical protein DWU98_16330 [Dyella monticola]
MGGRPKLIAIDHDDYHAEHIGCTRDGRRFILTNPFDPAIGNNPGCEFVALYIFDKAGQLIDAKIDSFGPRSGLDEDARSSLYEERLTSLGDVSIERIEVAPFAVERFDLEFGLIARPPQEDDDAWAVEMQPGNYMAFFEPWDSGEYDT